MEEKEYTRIPIRTGIFGGFRGDADTASLLAEIGGGDKIRAMCTHFYTKVSDDVLLKTFLFMEDGFEAHGKRLGDWIIEKMTGEGAPWTASGRKGLRQESHRHAWNNVKRDPKVRGKHFKLHDCRVWMRLMFWAGREVGLADHHTFWAWYVDFIGHFIAIYERKAPKYAKESAKWSSKAHNVEKYIESGYNMEDVFKYT